MSWWRRWRSRQKDVEPPPAASPAEKDWIESSDLIEMQSNILGRDNILTIIDANAAHGWWSERYLKTFGRSRVITIEPSQDNLAEAATRLMPYGGRVELLRATLDVSVSAAGSQSDAHNASHSACGSAKNDRIDHPLVLSASDLLASRTDSLAVDHICAERGVEVVDIFRMEIRGTGIEALMGAEGMLSRSAIRLLSIRVGFVRRPGELPAFGAVTEYLRRFGYELQGIYEAHRDSPMVLREAEAIFIAPQLLVRGELPSTPSVLNETIESIQGQRLPDKFLRTANLQGGAVVRALSSDGLNKPQLDQQQSTPIEVASILEATIDTSAEPYTYSLLFHADDDIRQQFHEDELVVAEIAITVLSGKVGIVWADHDYQPLVARERHVLAMSAVHELQHILVQAPAKDACHLVFRNVANDSTPATFKVIGIRAKRIGVSLRRALGESGAEALYLRAFARERAGDRQGAARLLADAAALVPDYMAVLEAQGELLDIDGRTSLAMSKYDAVRKLQAESPKGAPDRCLVLRRRGRFTDQIATYSSLLHTVKHGTFPYIARGNSFLSERRADAALRDYESALELRPDLPEVMALKGEALNMLGCFREALKAFDLVLAKRPRDPEVLSGRAIAYLAMGKLGAADADWRRQLVLLTPFHAAARACISLRLADYELAAAELERALASEPDNPYWRLYHITALRRLGRPIPSIDVNGKKSWPDLLLALHAGIVGGDHVLKKAINSCQRAEALFQLGIMSLPRDPKEALRLWAEVIDQSSPDMIEHAAACHELARLHS